LSLVDQGNLLRKLGRDEEALQAFDRARAGISESENPRIYAVIEVHLAVIHAKRGRFAESIKHAERGLALRRKSGDHWGETYDLISIGRIRAQFNQKDEAVSAYRQAIRLCVELGDLVESANARTELAAILVQNGSAEEAKELWRQALPILEQTNDPRAPEVRARLAELD
jgi:tetratricopeptide (TPR) repeat protein